MMMKSSPDYVEIASTDGHVAADTVGGFISAMKLAYEAVVHML